LFRAPADREILGKLLRLIPHHPEHADASFAYLAKFGFRVGIQNLCIDLINRSPYSYLRGEAFHVLARLWSAGHDLALNLRTECVNKAITLAKNKKTDFAEAWGAGHFLLVAEAALGRRLSKFVQFYSPLAQALLVPALPEATYAPDGVVGVFLGRTMPEPGLALSPQLHARAIVPQTYGIADAALPTQVRNALRVLGVLGGVSPQVDPIAEVLADRYGVPIVNWRTLLGASYTNAMGLLRLAEAAFASAPSYWLLNQNSFNNQIFMSLQEHFGRIGDPARQTIIGRNLKRVKFGVLLTATNAFPRLHPRIADCFREMNDRRNSLPSSHPFEEYTGRPAVHLKARERNAFVAKMRLALVDFVALMPV
jgi:hypothetical protein